MNSLLPTMSQQDTPEDLSGLVPFAGLSRPQLEAISRIFDQEMFPAGTRVLRQGFSGSNFYVIAEGQPLVRIEGADRATLGRGDCIGEISILLGEPPTADVVAVTPLKCLSLPATSLIPLISVGHVPDASTRGIPPA